MDSEKACAAVAQGEIELAVVTLPPRTKAPPPLRAVPVWDDPLEIVASPEHPLAQDPAPTWRRLLAYPAILPGAGTYTREIIVQALGPLGRRIQVGMTTNYLEVLKMLAAIGLGWSVLPRTMIDGSLKVVRMRKRIRRRLGIVTHQARTLSNAARAMIEIVRERS
jgi:DNA-binding transcriptional LysR family regulator